MVKILLIGGEKGGTGKSTIAVNLAAMLAGQGADVCLVDMDPQKSASKWARRRQEDADLPQVSCIQLTGKGSHTELAKLSGRYQTLVVDSGGRDSIELRGALTVADMLVSPLQPGQFDIETLTTMADLVGMASSLNEKLRPFLMLSRTPTNSMQSDAVEARELLLQSEQLGVLESVISSRTSVTRSVAGGRAVTEYSPRDSRAVAEFQLLFDEIYGDEQ